MPRKARILAISSIYHIVIRGLDRQIMFECENDYKKYMEVLSIYKDECHFELYAYCLMSNHVHIMLKTTDTALESIFRRINTNYAIWFNMKYQRTGHLLQDRFYSEPIESKQYFLNAIRYIHQNPLNAGLENAIGASYKWSSIHEYLSQKQNLIDMDPVLKIEPYDELMKFMFESSTDSCLDIDSIKKRMPDDVAKELICKITGCNTCLNYNETDIKKRNEYIQEFHKNGISIRQINRLTGISKGIIQRVIKQVK